MPKVVISDTSTLILFHKIDEFDLLNKVYVELITTPEIAEEFGEKLPDWIKIQSVSDKKYQLFLETQIDSGEASAIALATEYDDAFLLLEKYADQSIENIENIQILTVPPINEIGSVTEIIKAFGNREEYEKAIRELQNELYNIA